jgi:ABC-2 type transport system permease protein
MLWYKAWLETRTRFLISLIAITALAALFIWRQDRDALPTSGMWYYYSVLAGGHRIIAMLWVVAIMFLMMGGIIREKAVGASSFTLALPVSRARLMWTRIAMGLLQSVALGLVSWTAMWVIACTAGKPIAVQQAATYVTVMFGAGTTFFAVAVFTASMLEGEYTAPLVAFGTLIAFAVALNDPPLRTYSPWFMLLGSNLIDRKSQMLTAPIPWSIIAAYAAFAAVLLVASVKLVDRREF